VYNHVTAILFQLLQSLGAPHVESFNYVLREGLDKAVKDILAVEFSLHNNDRICIKFEVRQTSGLSLSFYLTF
jgi:DNA-directed RNA polymerase I subunit RPA2